MQRLNDCGMLSPIWENYNTPSKAQGVNLTEKGTERMLEQRMGDVQQEKLSSGHDMATGLMNSPSCLSA